MNNAFIQGDVDEEVFMDIPEGFDQHELQKGARRKVCKLLKSLYRLKQVSRQWNLKHTQALLDHG